MMLKKVCPKCGKTWYSSNEIALLFCLDCDTSLQNIPAKIVDTTKEITECFWCGERMIQMTKGQYICPSCGWKWRGKDEK